MLLIFSLIATVICAPQAFAQTTLSMTVGRVEDHVFTSREVQMRTLIDRVLRKDHPQLSQLPALDSKTFYREVDNTLLDDVLYLEAQNFNVAQIDADELKKAEAKIDRTLGHSPAWNSLDPQPKEWRPLLHQKLVADRFIRFRKRSSLLPVTDTEAKRYFDQNRVKFGSLPFDNFKENIKAFLSRSQVERRLKDWFEVIKAKHQAKNYLSEI